MLAGANLLYLTENGIRMEETSFATKRSASKQSSEGKENESKRLIIHTDQDEYEVNFH